MIGELDRPANVSGFSNVADFSVSHFSNGTDFSVSQIPNAFGVVVTSMTARNRPQSQRHHLRCEHRAWDKSAPNRVRLLMERRRLCRRRAGGQTGFDRFRGATISSE
jgi:hypothetical protein